ncbi:Protein kinase domain [seawater metagenome]|uniref:Protein kinase domain n=1 Tax=seawater metagenome TaxID=1561972 RepID=A0A5E8CK46_9ZZZZ
MGICFGKIEKKYEIIRTIQTIKNGEILLAEKANKYFVMKRKTRNRKQFHRLTTEREILKILNCKYIIKIVDTLDDEKYFINVFPYTKSIDMYAYFIENNNIKNESIIKKSFYQLFLALQYLKNNDIIHRDIKLENILINEKNHHVCLIDFDLAIIGCSKTNKLTGTEAYLSPELLNNGITNFSNDIWGAGVSLFIILFENFPFGNDREEIMRNQKTYKMNFLECINENMSYELLNLLNCMLTIDYKQRVKIEEILRNYWIQSI